MGMAYSGNTAPWGGQPQEPTGMLGVQNSMPPGAGAQCPPWMPNCRGQGGGGGGGGGGFAGTAGLGPFAGGMIAPVQTQAAPTYNGTWAGPSPTPPTYTGPRFRTDLPPHPSDAPW